MYFNAYTQNVLGKSTAIIPTLKDHYKHLCKGSYNV